MTKLEQSINISRLERESECRIGEKISVQVPDLRGRLVSNDVSYPSMNGDQYLDFSQVKGMTFTIPVCPCSSDGRITASITVQSKSDFAFLRDYIHRTAWLEQSACVQLSMISTAPLPSPAPVPDTPPSRSLTSVGILVGSVASHFGTELVGNAISLGALQTATPAWVGEYFKAGLEGLAEDSSMFDEMIQQAFQDSLPSASQATPSDGAAIDNPDEEAFDDEFEFWEEEI